MVQQDSAEDLKTIGKSVYQITYDEAGNPKMTLVPGSPTTPVGGSGGGTGTDASGLPKGFTTTTQKTLENLATGKMNWGSAFDSVKALYPQVDNNLIDTFLNKERWSAPGAYEIKKQSEFKSDGSSDYETVF